MIRIPTLAESVLALMGAFLGAALYSQIFSGDVSDELAGARVRRTIPASSVDSVAAPPMAVESEFSAVSERPLFLASRRPFTPPPTAPRAASPPVPKPATPRVLPPNAILSGVVIGPNKKYAIFQQTGTAAAQTVSEGDSLSGWEVKEIQDDRVIIEANSVQRDIKFPAPGTVPTRGDPFFQTPPGISAVTPEVSISHP